MFGAIEAGGTKFVCGIGTGPHDLVTAQFPTSSPDVTLASVIEFFKDSGQRFEAFGVGSFGPVDLDLFSPTYGHITSTPKTGWSNFDLVGAIRSAFDVPVAFDTDVNAAVLGEARWGAARGLSDAVYLTIGTGIGGGALVRGQVVHGLVHPEMGHLRIPHDLTRDPFPGCCPFHGDCLEGLACGPAMQMRWGAPAGVLPPEHEAWALEAHYLALGLVNLTVTLSPRRILLGGGVMQQPQLFDMIREQLGRLLNGYVHHPEVMERIASFIQPPQLGSRAGILGSLALAQSAVAEKASIAGGRA
ncbi:MAG: ROK family protein [Silvibacterium sp.]|nr:ROK family protein [Silvibacterium sp.]MBV8550304.1 ROK family protein [Acidobacteriaceae bacterium]